MAEQQNLDNKIRAEQLRQLYARVPMLVVVTFIIATILAIIQWKVIEHAVVTGWWVSMMLITALYGFSETRYKRVAEADVNIGVWTNSFFVITLCSGLAWGSAGFSLFPEHDVAHQFMVVIVVAGISSVSVTTLAARFGIVITFLCATLIPLMLHFFMIGEGQSPAIGSMVMVYLIGLIMSAYRTHKITMDAITFHLEDKEKEEKLNTQTRVLQKTNEEMKLLYKELEEKNKELQKLDELKSDFISTVSHELRTPLTSIRGVNAQMLEGILGETTDKQKKFLGIALRNIDRLKRLIDNLLDVSKIEAGQFKTEREMVDVVDLVQGIVGSFSQRVKEKGIEIRSYFSEGVRNIYADEDKIAQVFTNLVSNACNFTQSGQIDISVTEKDNWVECSVSDTGKGIAEQDLSKVFDKFEQFGRVEEGREGGAGLGLSIVKGIIEEHNGQIWIESELNKGTKFTFTLPKYIKEDILVESIKNVITLAEEEDLRFSLYLFKIHNYLEIKNRLEEGKTRDLFIALQQSLGNVLGRGGLVDFKEKDEILVLIQGSKEEDRIIKKSLKRALKSVFFEVEKQLEISFSYGWANYPEHGDSANALLKRAEGNFVSEKEERLKKKIMVIDDESSARDSLKRILGDVGYECLIEAGGGNEAIEQIKTVSPDLIMLDMEMPGMNGYEVMGRLKTDIKTEAIPIVVMAGLEMSVQDLRAYTEKRDIMVVNKPFNSAEVKKLVNYLL